MNQVSNVSAPPRNFNPPSAELTQENFLKLLMTQLKLQNPTNPFDSSTMMQQMAQLTSLAANQDLQKSIKAFGEGIQASQVLSASNIVGKEVHLESERAALSEGRPLKGSVLVPDGIKEVTVEIRDDKDQLVKTITLTPPSHGLMDFSWDGLDKDGNRLANGLYKLSAKAMQDDKPIDLPTAGAFKVNSVALDRNGKGVILNLDEYGGVYLNDVIKIL